MENFAVKTLPGQGKLIQMHLKLFLTPLIFVFFIPGCASIISGDQQKIKISVICKGVSLPANCVAQNSAGNWRFKTPANIIVNKSSSDLKITCKGATFGDYSKIEPSTASPILLGNIIAGGILGAAVDYHTSAGRYYSSEITIETPLCKLM